MTARIRSVLIGAAIAGVASAAWAQVAQPPAPPPEEPVEKKPEQPAQPLPGLDELLGLDEEGPARQGEGLTESADPSKKELEQKLSGREVAQAFQDAVRLMGDSATRMTTGRDVGLTTQRLQEEAIRKLEMLIQQAQKQQSQSQSRSSSRDRKNQSQPNQPQQQQQNQPGNAENRGQVDPPARQEGPLGPDVGGTTAGWGNLPTRVRDALRQSQEDRFSAVYRAMTEAYYRRIAEEAGK
jgi:hypothetical protein